MNMGQYIVHSNNEIVFFSFSWMVSLNASWKFCNSVSFTLRCKIHCHCEIFQILLDQLMIFQVIIINNSNI